MKRSRFFLTATVLLPLLCLCLQGWWATQMGTELDMAPMHTSAPLKQQPLEDERQYAEDGIQYAISASPFSTKHTKWDNGQTALSSTDDDRCHLMKQPVKHSPHLPSPSNGRSVVIRLHHLII